MSSIRIPICSVIAVASLGWGCTSDSPKTKEPEVVRVARSTLLTNAPFAIGDEEGTFANEGIRIEFVDVPDVTTQALPPLETGSIDVLGAALSIGLINGVGSGATFRIVADRTSVNADGCEPWAIVGRKDYFGDKPLTAELLRGATVSTNAVGQSGYIMDVFLRQHGLTLEDLEVVRLQPTVEPQAMAAGTIDIITRGDPHLHNMLRQGHRLLAGSKSVVPGYHLAVLVYGPSLLRNRDLGVRFMKGYLNAVAKYQAGPTPGNIDIVSRRFGLDASALREMCWPHARANGSITKSALVDYQRWAVRTGELKAVIDPENLVDSTFAAEAYAAITRR